MNICYTDISDETWQRLEPVLPLEGSPKGGRPAKDKRTFINAIIWLLRTGAPWRALPEEYGSWNAVYSRFRR
ncbi:transposase [Desulfomicrobium orale]|uniref:transposase n=1 Tax=Desulfomicrobium orale TaxID=132132 RepID=UPI0009FB01FC|nr:transposase [Desulfomicrobium orale]